MAIDLPDDLIELEHFAWTQIQEGTLTVETADAVQQRIREFAKEGGHGRLAIEMALKKHVRHPAPETDAA